MQPKEITSLTNPRVKNLIRLRQKKYRDQTNTTIVEGSREIARLLEAEATVKEVYLCPELLKKGFPKVSLYRNLDEKSIFHVSLSVFEKVSYGEKAEGILLVVERPWIRIESLVVKDNPLYVVVENVEKPGNLGAILRTCDGAGVDAVFVADQQTDIFHPNVIRSSLGTIFSLPVLAESKDAIHSFLTERDVRIFAATPQTEVDYYQQDLSGPTAIVLGSESRGLSDFWFQGSEVLVKIPMRGKADSLNVSVSAAVLLYEAVRQRKQ